MAAAPQRCIVPGAPLCYNRCPVCFPVLEPYPRSYRGAQGAALRAGTVTLQSRTLLEGSNKLPGRSRGPQGGDGPYTSRDPITAWVKSMDVAYPPMSAVRTCNETRRQ